MIIDFESSITEGNIPYKLPNNWTWYNWNDIMKSYQQGLIRSNSQVGQGNVKYLKMGDISSSGMADLSNLKLTNANEKEIQLFKLSDGDFLINVRNSMSLVGKTCVITSTSDSTILFNHMLVRIDNGSPELNYYVNAYLNIPTSKKLLDRLKEGTTTVIALYQRELKNLPIAIPDEITFRTIVSFYRTILNKIELNNKINGELEAIAKLIYDYWFVQFDFPDENGKPYKSSGGKMVYNEVLNREIPEGWVCANLSSITNLNPSLSIPKGHVASHLDMRSIPEMGYMTELPINKEFKGGVKFQNGDVVIARITPCLENGKTAFISLLDNDEIGFGSTEFIVLRGVDPDYYSFLAFLARSVSFRTFAISKMTGTSGRRRVSASDLGEYKLAIPTDLTLFSRFNKLVMPKLKLMTSNTKENDALSKSRDWLLPMLMNGQVTIKN